MDNLFGKVHPRLVRDVRICMYAFAYWMETIFSLDSSRFVRGLCVFESGVVIMGGSQSGFTIESTIKRNSGLICVTPVSKLVSPSYFLFVGTHTSDASVRNITVIPQIH